MVWEMGEQFGCRQNEAAVTPFCVAGPGLHGDAAV